MPQFRTTAQIFKVGGDVFDPNWADKPTVQLPPNPSWDYSRELHLEDVDIWEVIYEQGGGVGVYASWCPYAEFYLLRTGWWNVPNDIEVYYGPGSQVQVQKRMKEMNLPLSLTKQWVDPEDMWLYVSN